MKVFPKRWKLRIPLGIFLVLIGLIVVLAIVVQLRWDRTFDHPAADITVPNDAATIARGEYLYKTVSVCGACHSAGGEENPDLLPTGGRKFEIPELGTI